MIRKKATILLAVAALSTGGNCANVFGAASPLVSVEMTDGKDAHINISNLNGDIYAVQLTMQAKGTENNSFSVKPAKTDAYSFIQSSTGEIIVYLDAKTPLNQDETLSVGTLQGSSDFQLAENADLIVLDQQLHPTEYPNVSLSVKGEEPSPGGTGGSNSSGSAGVSKQDSDKKTEEQKDKKVQEGEDNSLTEPLPTPLPIDSKAMFSDVTTHWAKEYITYLAGRNIIKGIGNSLFLPDKNITRAEFVVILFGMANADITGNEDDNPIDVTDYSTSIFSDVPEGIWYQPAVSWASAMGIVNGIGDNKFAPNEPITREQICVMLTAYCEKIGRPLASKDVPAFADADQISAYATEAVAKMQGAGIISGKGDNRFAPKEEATRAEVCRMLYTLLTEILQ